MRRASRAPGGAIRRCVFSTGSFVEPITRWEEPDLLAFDVSSSPPPLEEWSPYGHIDPPHLHGHLVSRRGQFRLTERDGQVVLEGTTWYSHTLSPSWYWGPISDHILHRIHEWVLWHIETVSGGPGERVPCVSFPSLGRQAGFSRSESSRRIAR